MIVEFLYNELVLFGENQNIKYFRLLFPDAKIVASKYKDRPYFVDNDVDILFIGPMAEDWLQKVVGKLLPHRERLINLIGGGNTYIFVFNNALDIFGKPLEIKNPIDDRETNNTLDIFPYRTIRDYDCRKTKLTKFLYDGEIIVGVKQGFSEYYGNDDNYFYTSLLDGYGFNKETNKGGYKYKNTYLCELTGLPLITNPYLAKKLSLKFNGHDNIPLEEEMEKMYKSYLERI